MWYRHALGIMVALGLVVAPVMPQVASAETFQLCERTPVKLRLSKSITSGKNKTGEDVPLEVTEEIKTPDGKVVVARYARANGRITRSSGRGMLGRSGKLEFAIESVEAVDGTRVPLRAEINQHGRSNSVATVATAVLLSAAAVFIHGRDVTVKEGTEFTAYVHRDATITVRAVSAPADTSASAATSAPTVALAPAVQSVVTINPDAGSFTIDAKELEQLADGLRQAVDRDPALKQRVAAGKIAMSTFDLVGISSPDVARNVADDLATALIGKGFRLIEREQFNRVLQELRVESTGYIDPKLAKEIGKATGCSLIVVGSISDRGGVVVTNARLVDTQTGDAVAAQRVEVRKTIVVR